MKVKSALLFIIISHFQAGIFGQLIEGHVFDSKTYEPLEYVSIGVIDSYFGAITDENGHFVFEIGEIKNTANVRISMIGFESQIYPIHELLNKDVKIKMIEKPFEIEELTVIPMTERKVGADDFSRLKGWSGWGGLHTRKGYEMGIRIDLGEESKLLKDLNVYLHRQAFDTSLFRLHIRSMNDTLVLNELLTENIIISLTNESGWAKTDLLPYNLYLSGEIGLTLEWLNIQGLNKDRAMKINDRMQDSYILFKNRKNQIGLYRWGTEARWIINKEKSPSIYLTILE